MEQLFRYVPDIEIGDHYGEYRLQIIIPTGFPFPSQNLSGIEQNPVIKKDTVYVLHLHYEVMTLGGRAVDVINDLLAFLLFGKYLLVVVVDVLDHNVAACPLENSVEVPDQNMLAFQLAEEPLETVVELDIDEGLPLVISPFNRLLHNKTGFCLQI